MSESRGNRWALALLLPALSLGVGCNLLMDQPRNSYPMVSQPMTTRVAPDMKRVTYTAVDLMVRNLGIRLPKRHTILPTSFVDQNDLSQTSPLGRRIAIQMASRFSQLGYSLLEIKLRKNIFIQNRQGEFILSRDLDKIRTKQNVQVALTGSYVVAQNAVHVTAQLVRLQDQVVLTSYDFTLPMNQNVRSLLVNPEPPPL